MMQEEVNYFVGSRRARLLISFRLDIFYIYVRFSRSGFLYFSCVLVVCFLTIDLFAVLDNLAFSLSFLLL